jgi:predicted dehydrogenase
MAGKHVLLEKPHAIDPVGVRQITAAGELAKQKKRPLAQLRQLLT